MKKKIFFFVFFAHIIGIALVVKKKNPTPFLQKSISIRTTRVKANPKKITAVAQKKITAVAKKKIKAVAQKKITAVE